MAINSVVELYNNIKPGSEDDINDVPEMVADWGYKNGMPSINGLWIVDRGAWFPMEAPDNGCLICWITEVLSIAHENDEKLVINESVRMFLLSIINHKTSNNFPDELFFSSSAAILDYIINDSDHEKMEF